MAQGSRAPLQGKRRRTRKCGVLLELIFFLSFFNISGSEGPQNQAIKAVVKQIACTAAQEILLYYCPLRLMVGPALLIGDNEMGGGDLNLFCQQPDQGMCAKLTMDCLLARRLFFFQTLFLFATKPSSLQEAWSSKMV